MPQNSHALNFKSKYCMYLLQFYSEMLHSPTRLVLKLDFGLAASERLLNFWCVFSCDMKCVCVLNLMLVLYIIWAPA